MRVERLRRGEGRRDPGGRVVVAGDHAEHRRVDEDRRVDQARDGRDGGRGVVDGHGPHDVVEVVGRDRLADPEDQLVVEEGLAIPELVELLADQGRGDLERVEAREGAGQAVGRLAAELEELGAERAPLPAEELLGVEVQVDDRQAVEPPLARGSGRRTRTPLASPIQRPPSRIPESVVEAEEAAQGPGAGHDVDGRRVGAGRGISRVTGRCGRSAPCASGLFPTSCVRRVRPHSGGATGSLD